METGPPAESPNPVPATAPPARSWVWHATLESRKAGRVSVLACAETIFAVILYWWIAIRYDTHWHLVSSVFVAPLLLLRSTESIEAAVRWFRRDWFGFDDYSSWALKKRRLWAHAYGLTTFLTGFLFVYFANHFFLSGVSGWNGIASFLLIFNLSILSVYSLTVAIVISAAGVSAGEITCTLLFSCIGAGAGLCASTSVFLGVVSLVIVIEALFGSMGKSSSRYSFVKDFVVLSVPLAVSYGLGQALRSFFFRLLATIRFIAPGCRRLPENWRESAFLVDVSVPAEVMPSADTETPFPSLDTMACRIISEKRYAQRAVLIIVSSFLFLPTFLYRLNIKATSWFWWPLAFLLRPAPPPDAESQAKQALCWPWTNPFQKSWIVVSVVLVLLSLVLHSIDRESWVAWNKVPAIPLALKVSLAIDWQHIALWHWAQWVIAASGAIMLALAGNARSHDVNGNWEEYRRSSPHAITWMTLLQRVRALATISLLVMALGALAMQEQFWRAYIAVPETWIRALERTVQEDEELSAICAGLLEGTPRRWGTARSAPSLGVPGGCAILTLFLASNKLLPDRDFRHESGMSIELGTTPGTAIASLGPTRKTRRIGSRRPANVAGATERTKRETPWTCSTRSASFFTE